MSFDQAKPFETSFRFDQTKLVEISVDQNRTLDNPIDGTNSRGMNFIKSECYLEHCFVLQRFRCETRCLTMYLVKFVSNSLAYIGSCCLRYFLLVSFLALGINRTTSHVANKFAFLYFLK
jgi:hypothetical protein